MIEPEWLKNEEPSVQALVRCYLADTPEGQKSHQKWAWVREFLHSKDPGQETTTQSPSPSESESSET